MKYFYLTFLFLLSFSVKSQEVHWLINKDNVTDCSFIKSGKFINDTQTIEVKDYSIEFRNGFAVEKSNGGKHFLKSKITYTSECSYKMKVVETNIPGYEELIGKTFYTEILETAKADALVKIQSKGDEWTVLVLKKIED